MRPVPDDFAEMAPKLSTRQARDYWRIGTVNLSRWYKETGIRSSRPHMRAKKNIPAPADFRTVAPRMYKCALVRHYGVSMKVVRRWIAETGVRTKHFDHSLHTTRQWATNPPRPRAEPKPKSSVSYSFPAARLNSLAPPRDTSPHGLAAEVLRKYAPVYRCHITGRADAKGDYWRYGNVVLSPKELIERAEAKGFQMWSIAA